MATTKDNITISMNIRLWTEKTHDNRRHTPKNVWTSGKVEVKRNDFHGIKAGVAQL